MVAPKVATMNGKTSKKQLKPKKPIVKTTIDARNLSPALIPRVGVFQPTRRPEYREVICETKWGSFQVKGRLGQAHEDLLETAIKFARERVIDDTGCLGLLVDLTQIRKVLSKGGDRVSATHVEKLLEEMRAASVVSSRSIVGADTLTTKTSHSGIISEFETSKITKSGKDGVSSKITSTTFRAKSDDNLYFYKIKLSKNWTDLMIDNLTTDYRGKLLEILELRKGISQAISRLMLTHKPGARYSLEEAFKIVGAEGHYDRVRELKEDMPKMAEIGVKFEGKDVMS